MLGFGGLAVWRQLWLDDYLGTKELLFKATTVHTMQVYTERWFSDWQHHIKHALKWWWEHKREWYENRVTQVNTPRGRKCNISRDQQIQWTNKSPRT